MLSESWHVVDYSHTFEPRKSATGYEIHGAHVLFEVWVKSNFTCRFAGELKADREIYCWAMYAENFISVT